MIETLPAAFEAIDEVEDLRALAHAHRGERLVEQDDASETSVDELTEIVVEQYRRARDQ